MNEEKKEPQVELPGTPEPLNPKFVQKAIRTYDRDLAAALGKDVKDTKGVQIKMESPAEKAKKDLEARKIAEKQKADAELRARIEKGIGPENFVKPIEAFKDMAPSTEIPGNPMQQGVERVVEVAEKSPFQPIVQAPVQPKINPIPPIVPVPSLKKEVPQPIRIPEEKIPKKAEVIKTFETDVADMVKNNKASAITIAVAENKKKQKENQEKQIEVIERKNGIAKIFITLVSVAVLISGVAGFYYLYMKSPLAAPPVIPTEITPQSILPFDGQAYIHTDGMSNQQLISNIYTQIENDNLPAHQILQIVLEENKNNKATPITGSYFISRMGINVPNILYRTLTDRWLLGAYTEETGQKSPVLALTTDFFQNAFAGMLGWEKTMPDDVASLLGFEQRSYLDSVNDASSSPASSYFTIRGQFNDRQLRNRDVREFTNTKGELLFLYSFIDKNTILMTTTESVFISIIDRIEKQGYVR